MSSINLVPAYGRDYAKKNDVLEAYNANKDFKICDMSNRYDGAYVNKKQLNDYKFITIRYGKLRKVVVIEK